MISSNKNKAILREAKLLGLLSLLMGTAKLASVVWVQVVSMEILPTEMLPFSPPLCMFSPQECSPFLPARTKELKDLFGSTCLVNGL